jgi:hypothetical protein
MVTCFVCLGGGGGPSNVIVNARHSELVLYDARDDHRVACAPGSSSDACVGRPCHRVAVCHANGNVIDVDVCGGARDP